MRIKDVPSGMVLAVEMTKSSEELVAEDVVEYRNGQQEPWVVGRNPSLMIRRQSPAGDHAMHVVMAQQSLTPGVQDGKKSNLRA